MSEQTRPEERRDEPPVEVSAKPARARSRVREALVCPYCKDAVSRRGTLACARRGCGALYHRECWAEVVASYGGCAIYGCSSKTAKEVSLAGYLIRLVRLVVAAFLFPPRVVSALRRNESVDLLSLIKSSFKLIFWDAHPSTPGYLGRALLRIGLLIAGGAIDIGLLVAFVLPYLRHQNPLQDDKGLGMALAFSIAMGPLFIALALGGVIVFGRALASVLRSELSALARSDNPENTVLGRLRSGFGKKSS